jgi:phenylalanyl-tRNA synthetase beta chain
VRVLLSWLRDFAPFGEDAPALAEQLDDLGLVVEEILRVGEGLGDVVLARVLEVAAIPGADRIRKVTVDGGAGPVEIVCGAWNFAEGDVVPLAPVGAVLPGGFEIARRKMKGVVSNGMLCSGRELGLSADHDGIMVLASGAAEPNHFAPGASLVDALAIEPDVVFDIAVEANRPDAWCVAGVARDLAAALELPFSIPEPSLGAPDNGPPAGTLTSVEVLDQDLCPRFTARVLEDVRIGPSPAWMTRRLTLAGMRPINNVVDASNYAMLDLGQPTHPYDLDLVAGGGLRVRAARPGEVVTTLDGVQRRPGEHSVGPGDDRRDCLICDGDDDPIGIGGIMGGLSSEITAATRRVLLEAAYFAPMAIARTSKRLNLRSEASARFERGCDPEGIDRAAARFCELLAATAGDALRPAAGAIDVRGPVPAPIRLPVRIARVNALLGVELDADAVTGLLEPIGFVCERASPAVIGVTVPTFRPDTTREIDVVEEIARHFGYANVPRQRRPPTQVGRLSHYQHDRRAVREIVAGLGAHEAWTPSLLAPRDHERAGIYGGIRVANPLTPDESVLRQSLLPGMLRALAFNAARGQDTVRLFEIGHVFPPPDPARVQDALARRGTVVDEREMLGVALAGTGDDARTAAAWWQVLADALAIEGIEVVTPEALASETATTQAVTPEAAAPEAVDRASQAGDGGSEPAAAGLHPARSAWLRRRDGATARPVGVIGEVDPQVLEAFGMNPARGRVGWLEIDLEELLVRSRRRSSRLAPVSKFPPSDIDLAFVVDDAVPAASVEATLRQAGGALLESVALFDVYRGEGLEPGTRSLAYGLRLRAPDHTLSDAEVAGLRARCIEAVQRTHRARLRS